jgi:tagaturonate reductase
MKRLNTSNVSPVQPGPVRVLQFGEGNFLRGFVDWMIDILNEKTDFNSAVQIIQPLPEGKGNDINAQDGLYHVLLQGIAKGKEINEARLITCVSGVINPYDDWVAYLKQAENPALKFIVSNTTESGIAFNPSDQASNKIPQTFPGKLTIFLFKRYHHFNGAADKGLIFLPCELIDRNADTLKKCIIQYIDHWQLPKSFEEWIWSHNIFCNTLVDRIVTGFPKENASQIQQRLGYEDNLLVVAEPFHLWVIEGDPRVEQHLPFAQAGLNVKFVSDLTPYRTQKVRILNGAHTSMVPVAYLRGLRTVREAVEDPQVGTFVKKIIFDEIIPTLDLPEKELHQFASDVMERFRNPFINHQLISISLNSISKFSVRVLPSFIAYYKKTGKLPPGVTFSLAALIAFYRGTWDGNEIPLSDSNEIIAYFQRSWNSSSIKEVIKTALENPEFAPFQLTHIPGLVDIVEQQLADIQSPAEILKSI